jgi:phosphopantothenate synthetase
MVESSGGIAQTRQVLVVEPTQVTYSSFSQGNKEIAHAQRALGEVEYHKVVNAFRDNRFLELSDTYTGPPIADGTTEVLGMQHGKETKSVTINPYSPDAMTEDIAVIDKAMRDLIGFATAQVVPLG